MNIIRLFLVEVALRVLNSRPMIGMLPRKGTRVLALDAVVLDQAAEHDDAAILDQHVVVMVRLFVMRSTAPAGFWPMLELSIEILSMHRGCLPARWSASP